MAWSTRELAELAGVTVKSVRHYHTIGLLDEPERTTNGYKQYQVPHLVRLLQIKRLSDLGVPLSQVPAMGNHNEDTDETLEALDSELEATVTRLNRIRDELAVIRAHRAPAYVPTAFAAISHELTDRQRSLLMIYSTVFSERSMRRFHQLISDPADVDCEFESLDADTDEATCHRLAERMLPLVLESRRKYPWIPELAADSPHGAERAEKTMGEAIVQLYNLAQLRVLKRLHELLIEAADSGDQPS